MAALGAAAFVGLLLGPANAQQTDPMDDLLDKLKAKGVLSDDEYQTLKKAREDEQIELRQERRRQAQQAAQQAEKEQKAADEAAKKPKFDASPGIRSIQLFGDVRLRYESRVATSSFPVGSAAGVLPGAADTETLDRWRYALRIGIRGDLVDDWFYTLRFDTGTNPRSSWVTFGNTGSNNVSTTGGGVAPFGRGSDGIVVGQAYIGWRATPWFTVQAGKMANPLFTTPMVWDPDINPEGIAERFNYAVNDNLNLFANFGQYVYQSFSPNETSGGFGGVDNNGYMFAWQGGVGYKFAPETNARVGLSFYNYAGFPGTVVTGTPSINTNPNGFGGPFAFSTTGAPNTYPTNQAGLNFANGVNNLRYWELPVEVNFPIGGISAQVFGDMSYNIQADDRAQKGSFASLGSQAFAYQAGMSVGTNIGLTMNRVAAKKNTWEARAYWQQVDLNSLDPNLIDSDFFEGRTNLQGVFLAFAYAPT
ncbi:MAG TPA: putative porin, partial [Candidatus Acidoferrales bacterium]|nr:putative porin [Candidatus Acidoferrales bacterium]